MEHATHAEAADLLNASAPDTGADDTTLRKVQLFRNLKAYQTPIAVAVDPVAPVQQFLAAALAGTLTEPAVRQLFSAQAFSTGKEAQDLPRLAKLIAGVQQTLTRQTGLPRQVIADLILGHLSLRSEASGDGSVERVSGRIAGVTPVQFFVVQEDHAYRILSDARATVPIGREVLTLLRERRLEAAGTLLDWERELSPKSPEDPLGGVLLAHLWTSGQARDPEAIQAAAAALLAQTPEVAPLLPGLLAQRDHAKDSASAEDAQSKRDLNLLIASIDLTLRDPEGALAASQALLKAFPGSATAISLTGRAYRQQENWAAWNAMIQQRLALRPSSLELLREQASEQEAEGLYAEARVTYGRILASGRSLQSDENSFAWLSLFADQADDSAREAAERATGIKEPDFSSLHTLGCIQAVQGRAGEARQTLLRAMTAAHLVEPDDSILLGFALIAERDGEREAALRNYRRIAKPDGPQDPIGVYALAQLHVRSLSRARTH